MISGIEMDNNKPSLVLRANPPTCLGLVSGFRLATNLILLIRKAIEKKKKNNSNPEILLFHPEHL